MGMKTVNVRTLNDLDTKANEKKRKIRTPGGKVVTLPVITPYPGHIIKGRVRIKKTSHGVEFQAPTGMEQIAYTNWKDRHFVLLSEIKAMTPEEWEAFCKTHKK